MNIPIDDDSYLKVYDKDDVLALHSIITNERDRLADWLQNAPPMNTKNEVHQFITYNQNCYNKVLEVANQQVLPGFQWGIFYKDKLVGQIGFQAINRKQDMASVGYWISVSKEGKGLVTKACTEIVDYGFLVLDLNRIEIQSAVDNPRSAHVPERLGFTREAVLAQVEKRDTEYIDHTLYRMLREDWSKEV